MFQVEVTRPQDLSAADCGAWDAFRNETPAFASPLFSHPFAEAVAEVRRDAAVAVVRRRGAAVGFLAHHRRPGGLARPIGAPWSDYHGLVSAPDVEVDGLEVLRAAGLSAYRFSALVDPFGAFADVEARPQDAYVIAPGEGGAAYWETLRAASPKRFKNMRRLEHKLAREQGEPVLVADRDPAAFEALLSWKREQLRRTGLHDVLQPAWAQALMRRLFATTEGPLQGLLVSLKIGERPIAAHFGVREGEAFHPWIAAFDPALAAYSPGLTFMSEAIRAMPALGLASYDLSAGSDHYKKPFASQQLTVLEGTARTRTGFALDRLAPSSGPLRRVQRRLDHIAAAELSLSGRARGLASALAASSIRLSRSSTVED